jgi:molecular chaperone GrpE
MSNKARHHENKHPTKGKTENNQPAMTHSEELQRQGTTDKPDSPDGRSPIEIVSASGSSDLTKMQEERDKYLDMLRRTQAEFENYQKRAARDAENERKYCQKPLALEIIPALDNLDRFLSTVKEETELTKVVATVQKQLLDGLARQGIKRVETIGKTFDPNKEEAILEQPSDQPPGTVIMEVEAGYLQHDRVLRPAKVIVAKAN